MQATAPRHREPAEPTPPVDILVERARRGDARAFEELYRLHHRRVLRAASQARDRGDRSVRRAVHF